MKGKVIRTENKLLVVELENKEIIKCNMKGKFKIDKVNFLVGDFVEVSREDNDDYGIIEKIYDRKNSLIRPPVSNIDQVLLVFAVTNPKISFEVLDAFLSEIENKYIDIGVCFNKIDLDLKYSEELKNKYEKVGYKVILSSAYTNDGIAEIKNVLKDKVTALAGPSGVGKSSILNSIFEEEVFETGDLSHKNLRGKHTTKAVELLKLKSGGFILDTPGFTTIDLLDIKDEELEYTFREFKPYLCQCKFTGCSHIKEPECIIKEKVQEGIIQQDRYEMYIEFYNKLKNRASVREKSNKNYKGKKVFISSKEANKRNLK